MNADTRRALIVRGVVQGVGFRPFVARLADQIGLAGHVGNDSSSVFIEIEGSVADLDLFESQLRTEAPPLATIVDVRSRRVPTVGSREFTIISSETAAGAKTLIPPDVAVCDACTAEMFDPANRRYRHPFITCTDCGPRYTIITGLPYDRPLTSMAPFAMCSDCAGEYTDPRDRRYHAQPVACPACGPRLWVEAGGERVEGDPIALTRQALSDGMIVAIKGIGGFHLACDASNASAVRRLRERKGRYDKPFAVMTASVGAAARLVDLSPDAAALLTAPSRPIVLADRRVGAAVCDAVAPRLDRLGVMLAYAPVHHLLLADDGPGEGPVLRTLVMTSGNRSGEPLICDNDDARAGLDELADLFLLHDREIVVPCEDSVVDGTTVHPTPVRRSRGLAPLPVALGSTGGVVLAVGAELKNTFCLTRDDWAFCSPHIGDMGSLASQRAFATAVNRMMDAHEVAPQLVVADQHPGYATHRWAERYSDQHGTELLLVQHHHAHLAALLAEHGRPGDDVIGLAYDGTGFACEGQVWGGEVLAMGRDVSTVERVGHLQELPLPGGDRAVRTPARTAVGLLHQLNLLDQLPPATAWALGDTELRAVRSQLDRRIGVTMTSSVGRLFDAVSSLLGVCHRTSYEAQAAIELEAVARSSSESTPLHMDVIGGQLRLRSLVEQILQARARGWNVADIAAGFHRALAVASIEAADQAARARGVTTIGLTGGAMQNELLSGAIEAGLNELGYTVLTHRIVPPNDGGLALGQAVIGRAVLAKELAHTTAHETDTD